MAMLNSDVQCWTTRSRQEWDDTAVRRGVKPVFWLASSRFAWIRFSRRMLQMRPRLFSAAIWRADRRLAVTSLIFASASNWNGAEWSDIEGGLTDERTRFRRIISLPVWTLKCNGVSWLASWTRLFTFTLTVRRNRTLSISPFWTAIWRKFRPLLSLYDVNHQYECPISFLACAQISHVRLLLVRVSKSNWPLRCFSQPSHKRMAFDFVYFGCINRDWVHLSVV